MRQSSGGAEGTYPSPGGGTDGGVGGQAQCGPDGPDDSDGSGRLDPGGKACRGSGGTGAGEDAAGHSPGGGTEGVDQAGPVTVKPGSGGVRGRGR